MGDHTNSRERDRRAAVRVWPCVLVGLVFIWAAVAKTGEPTSFLRSINHVSFGLLRDVPLTLAAAGVWGLELGLGLCLVFVGRHRAVRRAGVAVLAVFTVVLIGLLIRPGSSGCGCLGLISHLSPRADAAIGIGRNLAMIGMLLSAGSISGGQPSRAAALDAPRPSGSPAGFTLVELLVVIAVIAVLVGLAAPALRGSRASAIVTRSLAGHQQLAGMVAVYGNASKDFFPYVLTPGDMNAGPVIVRGLDLKPMGWWGSSGFTVNSGTWINVFDDADLARNSILASKSAAPVPAQIVISNYSLTMATLAAPEFFRENRAEFPHPTGPWFRGMRWTDVTSPPRKGLLLAVRDAIKGAGLRQSEPVFDMSVSRMDSSAFVYRWQTSRNANVVQIQSDVSAIPVVSTRDGLRGEDFVE